MLLKFENVGRTAWAALLGAALITSPLALSACSGAGAPEPASADARVATKESQDASAAGEYGPESMVEQMVGLSDEERSELIGLYAKRQESYEGESPMSYEDNMRILALEHKDLLERARQDGLVSEEELSELKDLLAEFDALGEGDYLDYGKWDRLMELQAKAQGYEAPPTNASSAQALRGLSADELAECIDLYYRDDQDLTRSVVPDEENYRRIEHFREIDRRAQLEEALGPDAYAEYLALADEFDALEEGEYLAYDKWDRLTELESQADGSTIETNAELAADLHGLTDEERVEATDIFYRSAQDARRGAQLDYSSYERLEYFWDLDHKSRMEENMGHELYQEYLKLIDELKALPCGQYVPDETWDRIQYLEYVGGGEEYEFKTERQQVDEKVGLTDEEKDELARLYYQRDQDWFRDGNPTEGDEARASELEAKAEAAYAKERLSEEEFAEYESLIASSREGEGLTDDEWNRLSELSSKIYGAATTDEETWMD